MLLLKYLGKDAVGRRKDRSFRRNFKGDFPRGWKTEGTITKYDPVTKKYLIEGVNCIFNETGTFKISDGGDWFYREQIEVIDDDHD